MLGSNLSAMAGDGDMGAAYRLCMCCPLSHVSVPKAQNPRALARNTDPVGPPEAYSITVPYGPVFLKAPLMNTSTGVCLSRAECFRSQL